MGSALCLRGIRAGSYTQHALYPGISIAPTWICPDGSRPRRAEEALQRVPLLASVDVHSVPLEHALFTARIPPRPRSTERLLLLHLPRAVQLSSLDHVLGRHIRATRGRPPRDAQCNEVHLSSSWASCRSVRAPEQDPFSTPKCNGVGVGVDSFSLYSIDAALKEESSRFYTFASRLQLQSGSTCPPCSVHLHPRRSRKTEVSPTCLCRDIVLSLTKGMAKSSLGLSHRSFVQEVSNLKQVPYDRLATADAKVQWCEFVLVLDTCINIVFKTESMPM